MTSRPARSSLVPRVAALVLLALAARAPGQGGPGPAPGAPPRDGQPGPWDQDVLVYEVGREGPPRRLATFPRAGVATVARLKDGRLLAAFQHFPADDERNFDRVAVAFSGDEGVSWSAPQPIRMRGLPEGLARPFDPTLVPLPDGRVRLYFTSNGSPDFRRSVPRIHSGISEDGIRYDFEPGVRFAVEGRVVIDCAVALHGGVFHLYVPDNGTADAMAGRREPPPGGRAYHATSRDGLAFTRTDDVTTAPEGRWLGSAVSDGNDLLFFGTGRGPWPLASGDGSSYKAAATTVDVPGADPGAVRLRNGSWLLVVTGPPRPGTPSARLRPGPRAPR